MPKIVWNDTYYVRIYELARTGLSDIKIAHALGVHPKCLVKWKKQKPAVRDALDRGRGKGEHSTLSTFTDYVYERLPKRARKLWERLEECEEKSNAVERIEALLQDEGKSMRQHLFLHALVSSNFNPSVATKRINISYGAMLNWCENDPDFHDLYDQMLLHKKNFFEECLIKLCKRGDPNAIIFANRTINRDRGYGDQTTVKVEGQINHVHGLIELPIEQLNLPLETRKQMLNALRLKKPEIVEAEAQ